MSKKLTLEYAKDIANQYNGECLSEKYIDIFSKMIWKCKYGHIFNISLHDVKNRRWCSICSQGIGEQITRYCFEILTGKIFKKSKPSWLIGMHGNRLELDGYNENIRVAFEYQGIQHYKDMKKIFSERSFEEQKIQDKIKEEKCKEYNIILFKIPYLISFYDLPKFIENELIKNNIFIVNKSENVDIKNYIPSQNKIFNDIKKISILRGGKCLSDVYYDSQTKLKFECEKKHIFYAIPNNIKTGHWCPICGVYRINKNLDFINNNKELFNAKKIICKKCNIEKIHFARGLCKKCYSEEIDIKKREYLYSINYRQKNREILRLKEEKRRNGLKNKGGQSNATNGIIHGRVGEREGSDVGKEMGQIEG